MRSGDPGRGAAEPEDEAGCGSGDRELVSFSKKLCLLAPGAFKGLPHVAELFYSLPRRIASPVLTPPRLEAPWSYNSSTLVDTWAAIRNIPRIELLISPNVIPQASSRCPSCVYGGTARLCLGCFCYWGSILGRNANRIPVTRPPPLVTVTAVKMCLQKHTWVLHS